MTEVSFDIIKRIQGLLAKANKAGTQEEADAFAAKAQELLTKYNLDAATVGRQADGGRREEAKARGGFYQYQRDLYRAVAELNFCMYDYMLFYDENRVDNYARQQMTAGVPRERFFDENGKVKRAYRRKQYAHMFIGRAVNTAATKVMADYLEGAIERACRERLGENGEALFSRWAMSFREGATEIVLGKISERFYERLRKEQAEARKATKEAAERQDADAAPSGSTALTLSTLVKSEYDANIDFKYGEGTSARWAADRAKAAQEAKEQREAYAKWAAAHPEEAAEREAEERKRQERASRRSSGAADRKQYDYNALRAGREAGQKIGIDQQTAGTKVKGMLG